MLSLVVFQVPQAFKDDHESKRKLSFSVSIQNHVDGKACVRPLSEGVVFTNAE